MHVSKDVDRDKLGLSKGLSGIEQSWDSINSTIILKWVEPFGFLL